MVADVSTSVQAAVLGWGGLKALVFQRGKFKQNCDIEFLFDAPFWCQIHYLIHNMVALMNLFNLIFILMASPRKKINWMKLNIRLSCQQNWFF